MSDQLEKYRVKIDTIDEQLLKLVSERAKIAQEIGEIKNSDTPIYRPEREAKVLRRLIDSNPGPLPDESVTAVFRGIISHCRSLEKALSVAFLGPLGSYSEEAANKQFGGLSNSVQCGSIDEVFRLTEVGNVDYGIVPVENSTEGAVSRTLDLLIQTSVNICGEVALPVHHNLISTQSTQKADVQHIYAHAQALAQCHEWLNQHIPYAERRAVASNSEAARLASVEVNAAAIASRRAADIFGLKLLAEGIEDDPRNTTRFLVLATHDVDPSGQDKTSLAMSTRNVPGAVVKLLQPLADNGVSMTKLESRPAHAGLWQYVFFVDIEGHRRDEKIALALAALEKRADFLKVLGSYPAAIL